MSTLEAFKDLCHKFIFYIFYVLKRFHLLPSYALRGDNAARDVDRPKHGTMVKQGFPELYTSLHTDYHESALYAGHCGADPTVREWQELRLVQALLRASLLEQEKLPFHMLRDMDDGQ